MVVNSQQIISLTDFRLRAGWVARQAAKGKTFLVTNKGQMAAMVGPIEKGADDLEELERAYVRLQNSMTKSKKRGKGEDSAITIRKLRDEHDRQVAAL